MIYPIVMYGDPVLKKVAEDIDKNYPDLDKLIEDMFETMYNARGVGLAAPQIGRSIRLFIVDPAPVSGSDDDDDIEEDDDEDLTNFKKVFINPEILEESVEECKFEEGCLSIPGIRENISRPEEITIRYLDEHFQPHEETYDGFKARVIQHEYDHLEGVLFTDKVSPFKKTLMKGKLKSISKGDTEARYAIKVYNSSKKR